MKKLSWKTTSAGIILIIGSIVQMYFAIKNNVITETVIMTSVTSFFGGIGFLVAKDNNVTGGTRDNQQTPQP